MRQYIRPRVSAADDAAVAVRAGEEDRLAALLAGQDLDQRLALPGEAAADDSFAMPALELIDRIGADEA